MSIDVDQNYDVENKVKQGARDVKRFRCLYISVMSLWNCSFEQKFNQVGITET